MPFDTTYYIYSLSNKTTTVKTSAGGNEVTTFTIDREGITTPADTQFEHHILDSIYHDVYDRSHSTLVEEPPYTPGMGLVFTFMVILIIIGWLAIREREAEDEERSARAAALYPEDDGLERITRHRYHGSSLNLSGQYCQQSLTKHFPYYNRLDEAGQTRFINRMLRFIDNKVFIIYSNQPFLEMPLLISATAVQLTFGLKRYLLPHFDEIHIYPQEFMRVEPVICFLEGNVSGHRINLSWKHFIEGLQSPADGKNVGLHEMAHALHYQTFVVEQYADRHFRDNFDGFSGHGNKVYDTEMITDPGLYSEYAMTNFQEFWAESVELFFEKPAALRELYPSLYAAMGEVLNQHPLGTSA